MHRMLAAPAAVLAQLQAIPGVGLVLGGDVVPSLAYLTSERDRWAFVAGHVARSLRSFGRGRDGGPDHDRPVQ